jgi:hypothetical protein
MTGTIRKGGPATRGYVLIRRKPYRNWLAHRAVVDQNIREWTAPIKAVLGWTGIPADMVVHHMDHRRGHNCPENLVLCDEAIHAACRPVMRRCPCTGRFLPREEPMTVEDHEYLEGLCAPQIPCAGEAKP